jgi:NAD(P)-dependent dehydrogenase (short-subunit alcohol dehydrogenase family)
MANVIISGSASGIGLATREKLDSQGDRIIGIDIRDAEIIADLSTPEGRAHQCDHSRDDGYANGCRHHG